MNKSKYTPRQYFTTYVCQCPPPDNRIRSGRRPHDELRLVCDRCGKEFVVEKLARAPGVESTNRDRA
jgi:predicted SprT family Zn-dependent metalloprotease